MVLRFGAVRGMEAFGRKMHDGGMMRLAFSLVAFMVEARYKAVIGSFWVWLFGGVIYETYSGGRRLGF